MLICPIPVSGTTASGTYAFNTLNIDAAILSQIVIKAATATTTFDVKIEDPKDVVIFLTDTKATGTLRRELVVPLKGIHTVTILNASADETFTGKIMIREE